MTGLLFGGTFRFKVDDPNHPNNDRLIFSKGHACAMLYTCLAHRGFFPVDELMTFRALDSRLQGHPDRVIHILEVKDESVKDTGKSVSVPGMPSSLRASQR